MSPLTYLLIGYAFGCLAAGIATFLCVRNHYEHEARWQEGLKSAAIEAAMFLQRRQAGQCANELAAQLLNAVEGIAEQ